MNFLFCVFVIFLGIHGFAQEKKIRLEAIVSLALERNPRLQALEKKAHALDFRAKAEGIFPDPMIGIGVKNMGLRHYSIGKDMMSGIPVSISQKIPFPGKLGLLRQTKEILSDQFYEDFISEKLMLRREIKSFYAKLWNACESQKLLEKKKAYLENAFRITEVRYTVGQGTQADLFKVQVEISQTEDMILSMKEMEDIFRMKLNALLDFPLDTLLGYPQEISFYILPYNLSELQDWMIQKSPLLKKATFMIKEAFLREQMARKDFFPDFMLQAGKEFKGQLPDMYEFMIGMEIPIYFWKKQTHFLQETRLTLDATHQDRRAMELELLSMLKEHFIMAKTLEKRIALYHEKILPQAEHALQASMSSYKTGETDFLSLLSDINALIGLQMARVESLADFWSVTAKLEELTGTEILNEN